MRNSHNMWRTWRCLYSLADVATAYIYILMEAMK